jgi:acetyl/propionyl-CoA carboxylase alpha subunit
LSFKQGDIKVQGHLIEARLYAENPKENFLPSSGHIRTFDHKNVSDRIDYAYTSGCEKTTFYDPLLAKIISLGTNRDEAARSLSKSISDLHISGLETNRNFLIDILNSKDFLENNIHTNYIDQSDSLKKSIHQEIQLSRFILPVFPENLME